MDHVCPCQDAETFVGLGREQYATVVARGAGGIKAFQAVDEWEARLGVVEGEELSGDARTFWQVYLRAVEAPLLFCVHVRIAGTCGVDGFVWHDQSRITEGEIVDLSPHRSIFDAQRTTAVPVVVALATLERSVKEHE